MRRRPTHTGAGTPAWHARARAGCARLAVASLTAGVVASGPLTAGVVAAAATPQPMSQPMSRPKSRAAPPSLVATTPTPPEPSTTPTLPIFSTRTPPVGGERLIGAGLITDLPAGVPAPPEFKAGAYLIADLDSGDVIATKAPHAKYLPASTIKTLTTLTLVNRLGHSSEVTATQDDAAVDGTKVGMDPGAPYPIGSLFSALMMSSANDAAVALARVNGGVEVTTQQMNALARHLGALDTTAVNTSGLDATGQLTSVYDLALIGRAAVNDADVQPLLVRKTDTFPGGRTKRGQKRTTMEIANHNRLLWNYDGTIGVKNGYTTAAGATYIGAVRRGEKAYVFTYLKAESGGWRPTAEMFDWAFAHGDRARPVGRLVEPGELEAASTTDTVAPAGPTGDGDASANGAAHDLFTSAQEAMGSVVAAGNDAVETAARQLPSPLDDTRVVIGGLAGLLTLGVVLGARLRRR